MRSQKALPVRILIKAILFVVLFSLAFQPPDKPAHRQKYLFLTTCTRAANDFLLAKIRPLRITSASITWTL